MKLQKGLYDWEQSVGDARRIAGGGRDLPDPAVPRR